MNEGCNHTPTISVVWQQFAVRSEADMCWGGSEVLMHKYLTILFAIYYNVELIEFYSNFILLHTATLSFCEFELYPKLNHRRSIVGLFCKQYAWGNVFDSRPGKRGNRIHL